MSVLFPKIKLNNGIQMPVFGLGNLIEVKQTVKDAIEIGYRLFDCTFSHYIEAVGEAIKEKVDEGVVKREDLFIVGKLWCKNQELDCIESEISNQLKLLHTTYLDMCILYLSTSVSHRERDASNEVNHYIDVWKVMELLYNRSIIKAIGVSNFSIQQLQKLVNECTVFPHGYQYEYHPFHSQKDLSNYCQSYGILMINSPLSGFNTNNNTDNTHVLNDPRIKKIAERYGRSSAEVIIKYNLQLGNIVLSMVSNKKELLENVSIFHFHLAFEDMSSLKSFSSNKEVFEVEKLKNLPNYQPFYFDEELNS